MSTQRQQLDLIFAGQAAPPVHYELEAASRKSDPESSRRAAREIEKSGVLRGQRKVCLDLVKQYPGKSSKELSQLGTLDRYQVARRLADLKHAHLVRVEQVGSEDQRWYAVERVL